MPEVRIIQHETKPVLVIDVSGARQANDVLPVIARAKEIITASPRGTVRVLTDVTDSRFSKPIVDALTDLARHATPHLVASAAIGVTGLKLVVAQGLFALVGRKVELFGTEREALDWLVRQ